MPPTFDAAAGLAALLQPRALTYVVASGELQVAASLALHFVVARPLGANKELESSPTFRPLTSAIMLYPPLAAPFVSSALTLFFAVGCFGPAAVSAWGVPEAARFAVGLWLVSACHGIWLDYTVYRISWRMLANFWCGSFTTAIVSASALALVHNRR